MELGYSCGSCTHKFTCDKEDCVICSDWKRIQEPDFDLERKNKEGVEK